ncbi:MAG: hypothetical protein IJ875_04300 [Solobacterium sp.]|nr:hypothetical protein [Solobacterium sp.]
MQTIDKEGVTIYYERIPEGVYIYHIESKFHHGTKVMQEFLEDYGNYDIYLYRLDTYGMPKDVLDAWFAKLGFTRKDMYLTTYEATHKKEHIR